MVSLSHISLRTSIREQFDAALSFYTSKLGFQAVSTHNDKTVVFLHHFSAGSNTINGEGQGQGEHSGATVKLMLEAAADTTTSNAAHAVVDLEHKRKLAMLLSNIEMGNSSAPVLNAAFSFWVSNVHVKL